MLPTKFQCIGQAVSEENIFFNRQISNKNCLWQPCLLTNQHDMSNFFRGLSIEVPTKFRFIGEMEKNAHNTSVN